MSKIAGLLPKCSLQTIGVRFRYLYRQGYDFGWQPRDSDGIKTMLFISKMTAAFTMIASFQLPLALGATTSAGQANVRAQLQSMYDDSNLAGSRLDLNGMFADCDPGCRFLDLENDDLSVSAQKYSFKIRFELGVTKALHAVTKIESISLQGDSAVVLTKEHLSMVITYGDESVDHKEVKDYTGQDYWILTKSGWREVRTVLLTGTEYDDGKLQLFATDDHW